MRPFSENDAIAIGVFLLCLNNVTSIWRTNIFLPKWLQHPSDENLTDIPKSILELQDRTFYPVRKQLQRSFGSRHQRDRSRILKRTQSDSLESSEFFCNTTGTRSLTRPTSVHRLRPGDIDVIGSIGDSITVGTGSFALSIPQLVVEHRGNSWTGGGQDTWRQYLTLPNIIKVFNPNLIGYAYGDSLAEEKFSQFNVAEAGALAQDLPFMAKELVKRIKMDKRVNVTEDWKMISIMMGSNTFCLQLCYENYTELVENHRSEVLRTLLYLKENLPRLIVNYIISPNLEILFKFTNLPQRCFYTHIFECPCLFATQHRHRRKDYVNVMKRFKEIEKEVIEREKLKDKDDFAVVQQTFTDNIVFPLDRSNHTDYTYLAVDCFHFSQKGYARAANALWNNLMEPVGRKSTDWYKEFDRFLCPTDESPFISTWKNSMTLSSKTF